MHHFQEVKSWKFRVVRKETVFSNVFPNFPLWGATLGCPSTVTFQTVFLLGPQRTSHPGIMNHTDFRQVRAWRKGLWSEKQERRSGRSQDILWPLVLRKSKYELWGSGKLSSVKCSELGNLWKAFLDFWGYACHPLSLWGTPCSARHL